MPRRFASILEILLVLAAPAPAWAQGQETLVATPAMQPYGPESRVALEDGVSVRTDPGFVHRELYFLSKGQEVIVDGRRGKWFHVRPEGWVYEEHLLPREKPVVSASDAGGSASTWIVGAEAVNVRAAPNTEAARVKRIASGEKVEVSGVADGWCQVEGGFIRADLLIPPERGEVARPRASDMSAGSGRRWSLVDLEGTSFTIEDIGDTDILRDVRKAMRATGLKETDWTYLGLTIGLPEDARFRFNFDASHNTVVVVDQAGERYGSIVGKDAMERLPPEFRSLFKPLQVTPGEQQDAILLFPPALDISRIRELSMFIGGRLQSFYPLE